MLNKVKNYLERCEKKRKLNKLTKQLENLYLDNGLDNEEFNKHLAYFLMYLRSNNLD